MIYERVLFSIDNLHDIHEYARAVRKLSEFEVMGRIAEVVPCIGSFDGYLEPSFMVLAKDFDNVIRDMWFVDEQQTILRVPGDVRQPCVLEYLDSGARISIGPMKNIPSSQVGNYDSWTYVSETGLYFTTEK